MPLAVNNNELITYLTYMIGKAAHDTLKKVLLNKIIQGDVRKLSSDAQTSCLEGYHATLNYWHPKMIGFSWMGSQCR